jgi:hypothetical protein
VIIIPIVGCIVERSNRKQIWRLTRILAVKRVTREGILISPSPASPCETYVGHFETADFLRDGSGEGALLVPEYFTF